MMVAFGAPTDRVPSQHRDSAEIGLSRFCLLGLQVFRQIWGCVVGFLPNIAIASYTFNIPQNYVDTYLGLDVLASL